MQNNRFLMSDNWYIEENKAYFCGTVLNAVFCVDLITQICDFIAWFPESDITGSRQNPYCIKRGKQIFCLPGAGKSVWIYNIQQKEWEKIEIGHEAQLYLYNKAFYSNKNDIIWLFEDETGRVLKINFETKKLEKEFLVSNKYGNDIYGECIFVQNKLYCVVNNTIKCIDLNSEEIIIYEEEDFKANLFTICYDGVNFWLSGYCKEIYVWNPELGIVKVITDFPSQFGFYHFPSMGQVYIDCNTYYVEDDPFFYESVVLGKYVWFIPSQSSSIIYIDRETYEVNQLDIMEEQETVDSLKRVFACKYLLEYVRSERYIGLYSIKNCWFFEIDTIELCVKNRAYKLSDETIFTIASAYGYNKGKIFFQEKRRIDSIFFSERLKRSIEIADNSFKNIGKTIYDNLDG